MSTITRAGIVAVGAGLLVLGAAGCSGTASSATSPSASSPAAPTASSTTGVIGPVILTPDNPDGEVELGRTVVFDLGSDPAAWDLVTSDPAVLALTPGGTRDGATFNWGAETLAAGKVSVIATPKAAGMPVTFIVTVTG